MDSSYELWVKSTCPFCVDALVLLMEKRIPHTVTVLDKEPEKLNEIKKNYKWKTVPIIVQKFSDGSEEMIGGFSDLEKHLIEKD
jgi:glutaredoxin